MTDGKDTIALVTGASRGAGRGIAVALGEQGCTVYVTGRTVGEGDASLPGTVSATAAAVTAAGGTGIAVQCDHADGAQVQALFERIGRDHGRLDILVNNAAAIHDRLAAPGAFWEKPVEIGDMIDVGVRSGFTASWHAAQLMARQGSGLIAFTSSPGAVHYCLSPAYGAHKAGMDKLAADMAVDFVDAGVGVNVVSIWLGGVLTERVQAQMAAAPHWYSHLEGTWETPEFTGRVIWAMFNDPDLAALNGKTVIGAEMGVQYGITDIGGAYPPSVRDMHQCAPRENYPYKVKKSAR